jgi:hypothetical protein
VGARGRCCRGRLFGFPLSPFGSDGTFEFHGSLFDVFFLVLVFGGWTLDYFGQGGRNVASFHLVGTTLLVVVVVVAGGGGGATINFLRRGVIDRISSWYHGSHGFRKVVWFGGGTPMSCHGCKRRGEGISWFGGQLFLYKLGLGGGKRGHGIH